MHYIHHIYFILPVFCIIYLLVKRGVYLLYYSDWRHFSFIKDYYYWFEYSIILTAAVITPDHTYNEGIVAVCCCFILKIIIDHIKTIDPFVLRIFKNNRDSSGFKD